MTIPNTITRLILTFTSLIWLLCFHCLHSDFLPHLDELLSTEGLRENVGKLVLRVHVLNFDRPFLNALPDMVEPSIYVLAPLVMKPDSSTMRLQLGCQSSMTPSAPPALQDQLGVFSATLLDKPPCLPLCILPRMKTTQPPFASENSS